MAAWSPRPSALASRSPPGPPTCRTGALQDVRVVVPPGLSVSGDPAERFPDDRIVWWEDPPGDRPAQVGAIMDTATRRGAADLRGAARRRAGGACPVVPRADAKGAGQRVAGLARCVVLHLRAGCADRCGAGQRHLDQRGSASLSGCARARAADAQGITQKARIQARVAQVVRAWLTSNGADLDRIAQPGEARLPKYSAGDRRCSRTVGAGSTAGRIRVSGTLSALVRPSPFGVRPSSWRTPWPRSTRRPCPWSPTGGPCPSAAWRSPSPTSRKARSGHP